MILIVHSTPQNYCASVAEEEEDELHFAYLDLTPDRAGLILSRMQLACKLAKADPDFRQMLFRDESAKVLSRPNEDGLYRGLPQGGGFTAHEHMGLPREWFYAHRERI